ncbi:MAG: dihydrodipicolinate synthase family protein [Cohaesibacteraceae bacterium]|nr:dihydrodipicolinate synthase family protein [Cohaesibacteraceae bacterium]
MNYRKNEAKEYSRENMRGIWAAALNPMTTDFAIDEDGLRSNFDHWIDELKIQGFFIAGKQGEFFSMSLDERKRNFEFAAEVCSGRAGTIMSCSDQNFDTVIELAQHAQNVGADYIVVHAPILHFIHERDDTIYNYYKEICDRVDIGIAMWSHPDSGYLMSPELCNRIAELPNIMAIKYSVPRDMYSRLTEMVGDKILVSTASEDEWFDNIVELNWQLYLCSSPPYLLQTKNDLRMYKYTELAFAGEIEKARSIRDSLEPVRKALKDTRPGGKPQAHQKYWQELLGQAGGPERSPLLQLTNEEKLQTKAAFDACGLIL